MKISTAILLPSTTVILFPSADSRRVYEFVIAICRPTGDKWQSETQFIGIFNPRSLIVKIIFDRRLSGVVKWSQIYIFSCDLAYLIM